MRTAQEAPAQATSRLPANRLTATGQRAATSAAGRDRCQAGGQGDQEHDQVHRLVQDDGRECREPEEADQQRQAELCAAQPDHPAQHADDRSRAEYDGH
ncbi:hypothetical protein H1V43_38245 [Streptomyces sp. PSKA54]|uniref:Uncharacterized protein n=1 Tax=Streptomyces himalayensis subsp. aureolus TaxID=2758039 RepID=A0A7W2D948_9ACTN|nr:hypothetical protein [Streptomyces himalayensis]MBA4867035.1 hypothetical protein [Streptomyces himalayensis subsp. aureolus]